MLERIGMMPMPIDLNVTYVDGSTETVYIPLRIMRWEKPAPTTGKWTVKDDWAWAYPTYELELPKAVSKVEIDSSQLMADINRDNNSWDGSEEAEKMESDN